MFSNVAAFLQCLSACADFPHVSMYAAVFSVSTLSVSPGKLSSLTLRNALKSLALRQITNVQSDCYRESKKLKMEDS